MKHQSVLFLVPYPLGKAPSQRFRVEQFLPYLKKADIRYSIKTFMDERTWNVLYNKGSFFLKAFGIIKGFLKRWITVLFRSPFYSFVFIHREAAPLGPPVFEWVMAKLLRKRIVYDFDDAIWIPNTTNENRFIGWMKAFWKVKFICKWSYKVVCGNEYLCNYAKQFSGNVVYIPSTVDTEKYHNTIKNYSNSDPVIGWTGSHSTMKYLNSLTQVFEKFLKNRNAQLVFISDKQPALPNLKFQYIRWNEKTEVEDLMKLDIGIMPLQNDKWSEGKCGFKLIQYLSLGIPAVASPVGVNKKIIENGVNGFLCETDEEWVTAIEKLIKDTEFRKQMGGAGKIKIEKEYSLQSQLLVFLNLFR